MKAMLFRFANALGKRLSHRQRRFILDRLRFNRIVDALTDDAYTEILLPNGLLMTIHPLLHGHMASNGRLDYEDAVLAELGKELMPGDVLYDIGANVGVFALHASSLVGPSGLVVAFEPEENNAQCLRRSLERNDIQNITFMPCAIGIRDRTMIFDRKGGAFSGRLVDDNETVSKAISVPVRSIDSIVAEGIKPPTLIKIDVEGGEGAVLEGAIATLKLHRPKILCEMHSFNPEGIARAFAVLEQCGYAWSHLDGSKVVPEVYPPQGAFHIMASATAR